jgi:hypothetical protein
MSTATSETSLAVISPTAPSPVPEPAAPTTETNRRRTDAEVETWLREQLADGPRERKIHVTKQLRRVMEKMGVLELPSGSHGGLYWHLPEHRDVKPVSSFGRGEWYSPEAIEEHHRLTAEYKATVEKESFPTLGANMSAAELPAGVLENVRLTVQTEPEPTQALATVEEETSPTLGANMTDDALATYVIGLCVKIREMLPYIILLKGRFDNGERDSQNHLRNPIKGCYCWKEFCTHYLNRTPRDINKAFAAAKKAKELSAVTGESIAQCELDHQGIRQFAQNLLAAPDLTPADVASTLVAQYDISEPMAEAITKLASAEKPAVTFISAGTKAVHDEATQLLRKFLGGKTCAQVIQDEKNGWVTVQIEYLAPAEWNKFLTLLGK